MKINTKLTEMLKIDLPIIGAPMFLVSNPETVIAACKAGVMGSFPAPNARTIDDLRERLDKSELKVTALLTDQRPKGLWARLRGR